MAELHGLVKQFQQAVKSGDDPGSLSLFQRIKPLCASTIRFVAAAWGEQLGSFIEEIADEKTLHCLNKFDVTSPGHFLAFIKVALNRAAITEYKRHSERFRTGTEATQNAFDSSPAPESSMGVDEIEQALHLYAQRKRALVDQLSLKPEFQMSTLLLDQRQRMARLHYKFIHFEPPSERLSDWLETIELWRAEDAVRLLQVDEPTVGDVWKECAFRINNDSARVEQADMVAAIRTVGKKGIASATWRQRVCRYMKNVKDQTDFQERQLFHPSV